MVCGLLIKNVKTTISLVATYFCDSIGFRHESPCRQARAVQLDRAVQPVTSREVNIVRKVDLTGPLDWPDEADEGALEAQDGPDAVSATATPSSPPPVWASALARQMARVEKAIARLEARLRGKP